MSLVASLPVTELVDSCYLCSDWNACSLVITAELYLHLCGLYMVLISC